MNYTKGEWYVEEETGLILSIPERADSPVIVASVGGSDTPITPKPLRELSANAQLIAASPDLYEALKSWDDLRAMRPLDSGCDIDAILQKCSAITDNALAKAEGGKL